MLCALKRVNFIKTISLWNKIKKYANLCQNIYFTLLHNNRSLWYERDIQSWWASKNKRYPSNVQPLQPKLWLLCNRLSWNMTSFQSDFTTPTTKGLKMFKFLWTTNGWSEGKLDLRWKSTCENISSELSSPISALLRWFNVVGSWSNVKI